MLNQIQVAERFYLTRQDIPHKTASVTKALPINHLLVIDCSGSMSRDLPEIRSQLKNRLPSLVGEDDTVTIIWFSGRDQYGVLIEDFPVATTQDLNQLNTAIDRFLKPVGLTGFKQPLESVGEVIDRMNKKHPGGLYSLFFMSDGYDNQWNEKQILAVTDALKDKVAASAVVEYGWYCNRPLLAKMSEHLGGTLVFAEGFRQYEPAFEAAMGKKLAGKKVEVTLEADPLYGFAYALSEKEIMTFAVGVDRTLLVPEDIGSIYYFTGGTLTGKYFDSSNVDKPALYAALNVFAQKMLSNDVYRVLKRLGDVRLINQFGNCFGKQKYSEFQAEAVAAVFDEKKRLTEGYDPNAVPREDAFTVLDLLAELSSDEKNLFFPSHPLFEYKRTTRKAVDAADTLTEDQTKRIADLTTAMTLTKSAKVLAGLKEEIEKITQEKGESLKFVPDYPDAGHPISALVLNESRPNVSARITVTGTVKLPDNTHGLPNPFPTKIYRNYTIIRDGIINVQKLPVQLTDKTREKLVQEGVVLEPMGGQADLFLIDLRRLPVVNRKMVKSVSAEELFRGEYELLKLEASQKVFNYFKKTGGFKAESFKDLYGEAATEFLAQHGITPGGFNPKRTLAEAEDYYVGKELNVAIAGLSSLPSVDSVLKKIEAGSKLTAREKLLVPALTEVNTFENSVKSSSRKAELFEIWLLDRSKEITAEARRVRRGLSEIKFSVVVAQVWFKEFQSLDDSTLTLNIGNEPVKFTVTMKEIQVAV